MYAKFINRTKIEPFTGRVLFCADGVFVNPTPQTLLTHGYLPVSAPDVPDGMGVCEVRYEKRDGVIIEHRITRDREAEI